MSAVECDSCGCKLGGVFYRARWNNRIVDIKRHYCESCAKNPENLVFEHAKRNGNVVRVTIQDNIAE